MEEKNKKIINYFYFLNKHNRINASYLFSGNNLELAFDIAKLASCAQDEYFCDNCDDCVKINRRVHPDVFIIDDNKSSIKIEAVREIQKFLCLKNFQSKVKVLIINNAHLLTEAASNAFLKTLEEPPGRCMIMLISSRVDLILPTILSRCRKIYLPHYEENTDMGKREAEEFIRSTNINISDRKHLSYLMIHLISIMRDFINLKIYGNTNNLINKDSYEIISALNYSIYDGERILEDVLRIYGAIDNVNVNLACNLLKLTFG